MGFFDLPGPLFAWVDGHVLGFLPPLARLIVWAVIGAVVSMALYWLLSPQERITRLKARLTDAQRALDAHEGEFREALPLIGATLRLALRQVAVVTVPAVLASLPLLFLLVWVYGAYAHAFPVPADQVNVQVTPARFQARWGASADPPGSANSARPLLTITDEGGHVLDRITVPAPVGAISPHRWWNVFFGNPAGYLPADGPVQRIDMDWPERIYLPFGPRWLAGWEAVFFLVLVVCSVVIKFAFRIQ